MTISYLAEADEQMLEATLYDQDITSTLGRKFVSDVAHTEATILLAPFAQIVRGQVRSRMMKNFPYRFFYVVDEARQHIQVLAVLHTARDPDLWPGA